MQLVLLCHPASLGSASMPRFARVIGEGMAQRGHRVDYWTSSANWSMPAAVPTVVRKWLGYIDQYLLFPRVLRSKLTATPKNTVVVVTDHALGLWIPSIISRPHAIHCHDFLAQRSSMGEFPENPTAFTGRCYQRLIRAGYRKGRNFISVSEKTRDDLGRFLISHPRRSEVLHNALNYRFAPQNRNTALKTLEGVIPATFRNGYILHVGGNQWYKNRSGVLSIYREYAKLAPHPLPLLLIGPEPGASLKNEAKQTDPGSVYFLTKISDTELHAAYCAANILLFPSLEEGFGWPIIEAQACGCLVLTTGRPPMTEVGGESAFYLRRKPLPNTEASASWALESARSLSQILSLSHASRLQRISEGLVNAARFEPSKLLNRLEALYSDILSEP